jgi:hypothetical protein
LAQEKANNDQQQTSKASAEREKDDSVQLKKEDGQNQVTDSKNQNLPHLILSLLNLNR